MGRSSLLQLIYDIEEEEEKKKSSHNPKVLITINVSSCSIFARIDGTARAFIKMAQ